ncbi:MAG: hypothetical protein MRZ79_22130 [Bacteroidia bacterium]|nr:hypothetical protein [Bacteroidia bacterium]
MMRKELHDIEPFYGWLAMYNHEMDEKSPFHDVEHNMFYYDRSINNIPAHPLWDDFGSESLLVKIQYADYQEGYAILEFFGEWNDLYDNDFKLLSENVLSFLVDFGINKFIFIVENVFHAYFDADDYYQAMEEAIEDGWICLLKSREEVREDMEQYGIDQYFYFNPKLDQLNWRKLKPYQIYGLVSNRLGNLLEMGSDK